jgi:superfamily II DNA or RNA helicase
VTTLRFEDGTVRVEDAPPAVTGLDDVVADDRTDTHRTPAWRYVALLAACREAGVDVEDRVLAAAPAVDSGAVESDYRLRPYQRAAVEAWERADRRGVVELPTGSGKTVIGLAAVERVATATLVVVPTVDLLEQWRRELEREFDVPVGQLGGGRQDVEAVTVATYDSAYLRADDLGDRFGLVVFDEVHHLGGEGYREVARLLAAPARLGLTATFERPDGAHEVVADLVGPVVHRLDPADLAGEHLAEYDIVRRSVELTDEERRAYDEAQETFSSYLARSGIQMQAGSDYRKLVLRSGTDPEAREALLARQRARSIAFNAERKTAALTEVLDRHREDRVIVFAAHVDLVYRVAERFLIPAITSHTPADERSRVLDRFRDGEYARVVTGNVLDEGVDVPDANVAVVLSGSGSEREFTQRLGRVLRPGDGGRAVLYEVVAADTSEERTADRRR